MGPFIAFCGTFINIPVVCCVLSLKNEKWGVSGLGSGRASAAWSRHSQVAFLEEDSFLSSKDSVLKIRCLDMPGQDMCGFEMHTIYHVEVLCTLLARD